MVLRFAKPSDNPADGALGGVCNRRSLVSTNTAGWGRIQIPGVSGRGQPIIGLAASELYNAAMAPGVARTFGQTFALCTTKPVPRHKPRACFSQADACFPAHPDRPSPSSAPPPAC